MIRTMNPRRARLIATLAGLALAVFGLVLYLVGNSNAVEGENDMELNSPSPWSEVLDFEDTSHGLSEQIDYELAEELKEKGETQESWGIGFLVGGVLMTLSRWAIAPVPLVEPSTVKVNVSKPEAEQPGSV